MILFPAHTVVIIVPSDKELLVAQFERTRHTPRLVSSTLVALPSGVISRGSVQKPSKLSELLSRALKEAKPHPITTKEAIVVLPEQQVYLALLRITQELSPGEILDNAKREALSTIPLDVSGLYCDVYELPAAKSSLHEVVYAACDMNVAQAYLNVLTELKLKPLSFSVEPDVFVAGMDISPNAGSSLLFVEREAHHYWIFTEGTMLKKVFSSTASPQQIRAEGEELRSAHGISASVLIPNTTRERLLMHLAYGAARRFFNKKSLGRGIDLLPVRFKEQTALIQLNTFLTVLSIMFIFAAGGAMSVYSFAWSQMYFDYQRASREAHTVAQNVTTPRLEEIKNLTREFNEEVNTLVQIQSRMISYESFWETIREALTASGIRPRSLKYDAAQQEVQLTGIASRRDDLLRLQKKLEELPVVQEVISPLSNLDRTTNISYILTIKFNPKQLPYVVSL